MRIAVLGTSRSGTDPRTVRLVTSLTAAGHDVTFLSPGLVDPRIEASADRIVSIDTRWPRRGGRIAGRVRRLNPQRVREQNSRRHMTSVLFDLRPDLVYAANRDLAQLADGLGFVVAADTKLQAGISNSLARLAPGNPGLGGLADDEFTPWVERPATTPAAGRHTGKRIVLCYHPTETTPARYLRAALERAGVTVDHRYPEIDLSEVPHEADGVVFVESPYPALGVTGETPVPILYWVHHGEIHLYQNLRLAQRYRADAVLLAHSWHLAHRFPVPVHMLPFGVPTEMLDGDAALADRPIHVSMVAAGFDGTDERYATRRRVAEALTAELGSDRVRFIGGMSPSEMFSIYARSRAVIDEGGSMHRPITMRVFEATGSGAALATDPAPGLEMLFERGSEFITLDTSDPVRSLPADDRTAQIAAAGRERALGVHTYDHRVDELLAILGTTGGGSDAVLVSAEPLRAAVERFAEIDTIACSDEGSGAFSASSYVVWSHRDVQERHLTVDAVVCDAPEEPTDGLLRRAHRFVFCSASSASTVRTMLDADERSFSETVHDGVHVFDFEMPGYVVRERT
ncbi:MAG: glycosyltransferase [Actinomycetota bacterium]|nr:glycosyltransferase [Actinomycetota bacterium]